MVMLRMKESKFGAPAGIYVGKFLGIQPMKETPGVPRLGKDGKPMGPGIEWQFEILEGDYKGQIVGRITQATPTTKNSCGTLLQGLFGRSIGTNEDVDTDPYVGQTYQLVVAPSTQNPERTQVVQIVKAKGAQGGPPAAPPASTSNPPAAPRPPAPPAPPKPQAATPPPASSPTEDTLFWVDDGSGDAVERTAGEIRKLFADGAVTVAQIRVMKHDQTGGWVSPEKYNLNIPF